MPNGAGSFCVWIRGRRYRVRLRRLSARRVNGKSYQLLGLCNSTDAVIDLHKHQSKEDLFSTAIHEGLHACFPDLSEEAVEEAEQAIATLVVESCKRKLTTRRVRPDAANPKETGCQGKRK